MSNAFVANARANVDFLDSSSRLALTQSSNPRLRAFAHKEAKDATVTGNALVAFAATEGPVVAQRPAVALDGGGGVVAPIANVAALPLDVAANFTTDVGTGVDTLVTGCSVAIGTAPAAAPQPILPSAENDMDRLKTMSGRDFDALYRSTQRDALTQLSTLYSDYIQNGDDDALRALARRDLPKINRDLRELNGI